MKPWKNRRARAHAALAAGLLVLLSLLCSGCRNTSGTPDGTGTATVSGSDETATVTQAATFSAQQIADVALPATEDAGIAYQDSLIFVGDSLTAHLSSRGVLTGGVNTTQVWRTQSNMLNLNAEITSARIVLPGTGESMTIAKAAERIKPTRLIITLGTDWGVAYLNEADFRAAYTALVKEIKEASPTTTVILQSIFPVTADCKVLDNQKIDRANTWVRAVAVETSCPYLDTQSALKDANNCLKSQYCNSTDGIHLTEDAYKAILLYIRTHAVV